MERSLLPGALLSKYLGEGRCLEIEEAEAVTVRRIFDLYLRGTGLSGDRAPVERRRHPFAAGALQEGSHSLMGALNAAWAALEPALPRRAREWVKDHETSRRSCRG